MYNHVLPNEYYGSVDQLGELIFGPEYEKLRGTSAAARQLAGVCALLKQANPGFTPADVKSLLRQSAIDVLNGGTNAASNEGTTERAGVGPDNASKYPPALPGRPQFLLGRSAWTNSV